MKIMMKTREIKRGADKRIKRAEISIVSTNCPYKKSNGIAKSIKLKKFLVILETLAILFCFSNSILAQVKNEVVSQITENYQGKTFTLRLLPIPIEKSIYT